MIFVYKCENSHPVKISYYTVLHVKFLHFIIKVIINLHSHTDDRGKWMALPAGLS